MRRGGEPQGTTMVRGWSESVAMMWLSATHELHHTQVVRDWSESVAMIRLLGCTMTYVLYTTLDRALSELARAYSGRGHERR